MKLQTKLLLIIVFAFLLTFSLLEYFSYRIIKNDMIDVMRYEARHIRGVLMATRRVYHRQFLTSGIPLTDKTLGFLPAHSLSLISKDFRNWTDDELYFNNVSDLPRNQRNTADLIEKEAISYFRENPTEKERFVRFKSAEGKAFYHFSAPIWVEEYCLKCHGKKEDAPETIRNSYDTSFDYEAGDLRGVMSIKLPATQLGKLVQANFLQNLWVHLASFTSIFFLITFLLHRYVNIPLAKITKGLSLVGEGRTYQQIEGLSGEMAIVGNTFNQMSVRLIEREGLLKESEGRLRAIIDNTTAVIYLKDINGKYILINRQYEMLFNISKKDIIGKTDSDIFPKDKADELLMNDRQVLDANGPLTFEETVHHDSKLQTYISLKFPLLDTENVAYGVCSISTNITKRIKAEEQLRKLSQAVEYSSAAVVITDTKGNIEYANPKFTQLTGYSLKETIGKNPRIVKSGIIPPEVYKELWETIKSGNEWNGNLCNRKKNGELYWESASISPVKDDKGTITSFIAIKNDITKQKMFEEKITSLAHILEESLNEIYVFDAKTLRFIQVNKGARLNLGYSMEELSNLTPLDIKPEFTAESFSKIVEPLRVVEKQKIEFKTVHCRKDGSLYDVEVHLQLSTFQSVPVFVAIILDVTERKKVEDKLEQYRHNLESLVEERTKELTASQEKLRDTERLTLLGKVSGSIAHEIRNPLGVIDSSIYCLKLIHENVDSKTYVHLNKISNQVNKCTSIIKSLQDMSKMKESQRARVDIAKVVEDGMTLASAPQSVEVITKVPEGEFFVSVDEKQIQIVFRNLLTNAIQAMDNRGTIWIDVCNESEKWVVVSFKDSGPGITSEKLESIFEPFIGTKTSGFGFGLTLCKMIVERHGGVMEAQSGERKGATFIVKLTTC